MSSDQNVRILERLVRNLKRYVDLKLETLRLDAVSRITMLLSAILIGVVFFCLASLVAIMLSFAAGGLVWPPLLGGYVVSASLVALFYVVVALLLILFRKSLIIDPITRFLVALLLSEKGEMGVRDERRGTTVGDTTAFNSSQP